MPPAMSIRAGRDHKKPMIISPILAIHIGAGTLAFVSGLTAISVRKGAGAHRASGTVFVLAMLTMSVSAAYLAIRIQDITVFGAILAIYLVATAWAAVRPGAGTASFYETGGLLFA